MEWLLIALVLSAAWLLWTLATLNGAIVGIVALTAACLALVRFLSLRAQEALETGVLVNGASVLIALIIAFVAARMLFKRLRKCVSKLVQILVSLGLVGISGWLLAGSLFGD